MRTPSRFLFLLALVLPSCHHQSRSDARSVNPGELVQLGVGETASIRGTDTQFRVAGVNDSRCPTDVRCIWAGEAVVVLSLTGAGATRTDTLRLDKPRPTANYGGHHLSLKDVQPHPRTSHDSSAKVVTIGVDTTS